VIALRSPSEVAETGLRVGPSEKKARKLACAIESDTFSGPVCEQKLRNCGYFLRFSGQGSRISLQSRLCGGGSSPERTVLWQIPCNSEKYREIQAISIGTVAIEFAQNAIPEPSFSPSAPV